MNSVGHARDYLTGLLGTQRRKNIEAIGLDVKGSDYQGMEQFIGSSPWNHQAVMDQVAQEASELFSNEQGTGLFIDESSFVKKGKASVGVKRQWCGRVGKIENCQVGVFACLGHNERVCLTDFRLFLPENWAEDTHRLDKAKVPDEHRQYNSKHDQALQMIVHAKELELKFEWVGFDSLYGSKRELVNAVEDMGLSFVGDVHKTTKVWESEPVLEAPGALNGAGRPAKNYRLHKSNQSKYCSVQSLTKESFEQHHQRLCYRKGSKGELWARFWVKTVWTWESGTEQARRRLLIVRADIEGNFKYTLSNLAEGKQWSYYAHAQGQRYWVEHAFEQAKSQLGMAQYQVRVWKGWHHHMALVAMALLFSQKLRLQVKEHVPLLSIRDITELLDYYLPRKRIDEKSVMQNIRHRHRLREQDNHRREKHKTGIIPI